MSFVIFRVAAVAGVLLVAAACAVQDGVPARDVAPITAPTAAAAAALPPGGLATAVTPVGRVVTSDGFTLYRFDKDTADPPRSACAGACAAQWPPVLGDGVPALQGVRQELIGTIGRPDGTQQLTLGGWPLYRHVEDTRPGDVTGEGAGGAWHAIGVDGKPAAPGS
jgi:predicted lipoprotein with Yx(FWY)xxD motif